MKKRRAFNADFKLDPVMEGIRGEKSVAQICREREIKDTMYYKWRDAFLERAADIFEDRRRPIRLNNYPTSQTKDYPTFHIIMK